MKNIVLIVCSLLFLNLYNAASAQPTRKWATYYGEYADYGNYSQREVTSTIISCSVYDKNSGYLYVTGTTTDSAGIATPGSFQSQFHSEFMPYGNNTYRRAIFLAKFDTLGNRIWATYYGGNRDCQYPAIALDTTGNIYLTGATNSDSGIATPGSHQPVYPGHVNASYPGYSSYAPFLAKFDSNGQRLWATYYGGATPVDSSLPSGGGDGDATCIAYDPQSGCIYIAGVTTDSVGIASPGSFKEHLTLVYDSLWHQWRGGGAFLAKFNNNGVLQWGTYYGGAGNEGFWNIHLNETGDIYLSGQTSSDSGIATSGSDKEFMTGTSGQSVFLVKFDSSGQRLWSTYVGEDVFWMGMTRGDNKESGGDAIYISGYTMDTINNTTTNSYQPNFGGGNYDITLFNYDSSGVKQWATYFGGPDDEPIYITPYYYNGQNTLSMDNKNNLLMVGITSSTQGIRKGCHTYPAEHLTSFISKMGTFRLSLMEQLL